MDFKTRLRVKYGLGPESITDRDVEQWRDNVVDFMRQGYEAELAGHRAARLVFPSYSQYAYRSQVDTIHDLLEALRRGR